MTSTEALVNRIRNAPLVRTLLERRYERAFSQAENVHLFRGVYPTFEAAAASAPAAKPVGYNQEGAATMYNDVLDELRPSDYAVLYWLLRLLPRIGSVFDVGGHVGVKFYAFERYLDFPQALTWTVFDVPEVAKAGAELARSKRATQLHFAKDFAECDGQSLLFCSGSLQYLEASLSELLNPIQNRPQHLLVNTTPFTEKPTYFTLNSIGVSYCPYKIQNLSDFQRDMAQIGYELIDSWENPGKDCIVPFYPAYAVRHYDGMYFRQR